jgi:anti-anti-sigma factor
MSPLDLERIDGVPVVHVNEDIDAANVTITQQRLADALGPDASTLVIDLSGTRYLDSAGIDMLLRLGDRLDHRRAKLILVIPDTSQLKRLASIVGLPDVLAIYPTLTAALQEATTPQSQSPADLTIGVMRASETQTIVLTGEADLLGAPNIEAALRNASASEPELIVIDLRNLTFIDSSGLHALITGHELCRARGHELRIIPGPENVQRLVELTGLKESLPFTDAAEVDSSRNDATPRAQT